MDKEKLNTDEAAKYIKVSKSFLRKLMGEKKVTYYQPSKRTIFFLIEDLDEYLAKCKKN